MNYAKIAKEIDDALPDDGHPDDDSPYEPQLRAAKIIERACLEAQLETIREVYKRKGTHFSGIDLGMAYYYSVSSLHEEIEAKLKAMKV